MKIKFITLVVLSTTVLSVLKMHATEFTEYETEQSQLTRDVEKLLHQNALLAELVMHLQGKVPEEPECNASPSEEKKVALIDESMILVQKGIEQYWNQDYSSALICFKNAETQLTNKQARAWAQVWLARLYIYGRGVERNHMAAFDYFVSAATQNDCKAAQAWAWVGLAHVYWEKKDCKKTWEYILLAQEQNVDEDARAYAWAWLGLLNCEDKGKTPDYQSAYVYYRKAVEQSSNREAQFSGWAGLFDLFLLGKGCIEDFKQACKYFDTNEMLINLSAKMWLKVGFFLERGNNQVPANYDAAKKYFLKAACQKEDEEARMTALLWLGISHLTQGRCQIM